MKFHCAIIVFSPVMIVFHIASFIGIVFKFILWVGNKFQNFNDPTFEGLQSEIKVPAESIPF